MRDRLVDLINEAKDEYPTIPPVNCCKPTFAYYLADRFLANGVIVPPCKVGDIVYFPMETNGECEPYIDVGLVFNIAIDERLTMWISVRYESGLKYYHTSGDLGKTVFLVREEAEQALKGEHNAEIH